MSEYYDQFHRWEPLAEFHFNINNEEELCDDNYFYCICSRVFIRDFVKAYYDRKEASESDPEVAPTQLAEIEEHSHVHFSVDTPFKVKCDKDESASCYCSASHTENYCSTDEHDPAQIHTTPHMLQPSDSGADLTYQDSHSEFPIKDKSEKDDDEDYLSEETWEKYWAVNGERLIWASWIKKYSDYINPSYLDENNDLLTEDSSIPKLISSNDLNIEASSRIELKDESIRERKFSYDSKVNPYKKSISNQSSLEKYRINERKETKDEHWLPVARRRSFSEHDRMLSPRTVGTDSMTNVTKITLSSYDVTSSHVTSVSTPTDDYSVSSSTSEDQSNDKTRIAIIDEVIDQVPLEEIDTEQYWQMLWKKHFGEQYSIHYANFIETHDYQTNQPTVAVEAILNSSQDVNFSSIDKTAKSENENKVAIVADDLNQNNELCEIENINEETTMQEKSNKIDIQINEESSDVFLVQEQVNKIDLDEKVPTEKVSKTRKRNKKPSTRYVGSVGYLLQNLLKDQINETKDCDTTENETQNDDSNNTVISTDVADSSQDVVVAQNTSNNETRQIIEDNNGGDDDPPEEKPITLKRSHETEDEEHIPDKITSTFNLMGFCMDKDKMPKGDIVYRKRFLKVRAPRSKRNAGQRKTYYDEDGNPINKEQESQEEKQNLTDSACQETKCNLDEDSSNKDVTTTKTIQEEQVISTVENKPDTNSESNTDIVLEASNVALPLDLDSSFSDAQDNSDAQKPEVTVGNAANNQVETKRRRRQKRYKMEEVIDESMLPDELKGDKKMIKYWKKRHSLFHRFDEGVRLDRESWFSVTPESVAWHIANKCVYDTVLDAFCGAGGNTVQFARTSKKVIAIDIDPVKIDLAKHNAQVYGVADKIEFIVGDFFELAHNYKADMVFLSPPWGGPDYYVNAEYDIETMLLPKPASELMKAASGVADSVAMYLPRNSKTDQILAIAKEEQCSVEIEQSYLDRRFVAITAYYY